AAVAHRPRTEPRRRVPDADRAPRGGRERRGRPGERRCGMSAVTTSVTTERGRDRRIPFSRARDTAAIAKRNLFGYLRVPQLLVFSTIQPVIFVIMFRYVFGGAIGGLRGVPYVDFLMPGIFVQTVVFG